MKRTYQFTNPNMFGFFIGPAVRERKQKRGENSHKKAVICIRSPVGSTEAFGELGPY